MTSPDPHPGQSKPAHAAAAGGVGERSGVIKAAVIGGIFAVVAAVIGGIFAILAAVLPSHDSGPGPITATGTSSGSGTSGPVCQAPGSLASPANALAFDGKNLWVTVNSGHIFELGHDCSVIASYQSPDSTPEGITWDGRGFWVFTSDQMLIDHFRIHNGQVESLGSMNPHAQGDGGGITHNLAWDNSGLWLADDTTVDLLSPQGTVMLKFAKGNGVVGLAWDGSHLWLGYDNYPDSIIEEDTTSGVPLRSFTVAVSSLTSLVWADGTLWALGSDANGGPVQIYRLYLPSA